MVAVNEQNSYVQPISIGNTHPSYMKEQNDCVVRAYSNVMNIDYVESHSLMQLYGRRVAMPMDTIQLHYAYTNNSLRLKGLFGKSNTVDYLKKELNKNGNSYAHYQGITVENALKVFNEGSYVFVTYDHAFSVIDSDVIDTNKINLKSRVCLVYEVV